jgi:hypothetical protein
MLIEAGDGSPRPISGSLPGLRVEGERKRELSGQHSTIPLQIIPGDATCIHPEAQARIANELGGADGFLDGGELRFRPIELVFVN